MEHPSRAFLAGLEEDLIKLIMKHGQLVGVVTAPKTAGKYSYSTDQRGDLTLRVDLYYKALYWDILKQPEYIENITYFVCVCMQLIHSCVECLGAVVNSVTHNYNLVKDCFQRFFSKFVVQHQLYSCLASRSV